jgi:BirA family biotin operon repressor/biotin-[acetyl-CoA-carboxylase] ligase
VIAMPFLSRHERFAAIGSTNDVVRTWLATGTPEVCLAVADEQTAGRGRDGRTWIAPPGTALLASLGFRPDYLAPDQAWRLAASVSLAMADAAEQVAGLPDGAIRLKWPNDLVVAVGDNPDFRKLAGVLGETDGLGGAEPRVVVGIGINADWPAVDFPAELRTTMTSLHELSGGRSIALAELLAAFLSHVETHIAALRAGSFDVTGWTGRQATTGRLIGLERPDGGLEATRATGVDAASGALVVEDDGAGGSRLVHSGEIRHLRLADPSSSVAAPRRVEV